MDDDGFVKIEAVGRGAAEEVRLLVEEAAKELTLLLNRDNKAGVGEILATDKIRVEETALLSRDNSGTAVEELLATDEVEDVGNNWMLATGVTELGTSEKLCTIDEIEVDGAALLGTVAEEVT